MDEKISHYRVTDQCADRHTWRRERKRFWIEPFFRDWKSYGFELESIKLVHPQRLTTLLLGMTTAFDADPFIFDKHADVPAEQRPVYRLADPEMTLNVWEKSQVVDTVTLRAVMLRDPQGEKPAGRWPVVLLIDDHEIDTS